MKPPVKDTVTVPWMSQREIPAVKIVLSAWRKLRKDRDQVRHIRDRAAVCFAPDLSVEERAGEIAWDMEYLAAVEARLKKENKRRRFTRRTGGNP